MSKTTEAVANQFALMQNAEVLSITSDRKSLTLPVFVPLPHDFVPPSVHHTKVSFDLKRYPLVKGEVPDAYYESDHKARICFLGKADAVQSDIVASPRSDVWISDATTSEDDRIEVQQMLQELSDLSLPHELPLVGEVVTQTPFLLSKL